jgi:hypothetical protein
VAQHNTFIELTTICATGRNTIMSGEEILHGEWMDLDNEELAKEGGGNHSTQSGYILRSQSLDETGIAGKVFAVRLGASKHFGASNAFSSGAPVDSLSSSFDFSLLNADSQESRKHTPAVVRYATSWDEGEAATGDSCKRTKIRALEADGIFEVPATIRKPARKSDLGSPQLSSTPATIKVKQHDTCVKKKISKQTPTSSKRRRARLHQRPSPLGRVPPMTPMTPRALSVQTSNQQSVIAQFTSGQTQEIWDATPFSTAAKRKPKVSLGTAATAASTLLETTNDTFDSVDTLESSTPFRFTSFPASLPRINTNAAAEQPCPGTVRKRMSFGDTNLFNFSRDDETHNTSLSSLQDDGNYDYSDDDEEGSLLGTPVPRTRLNFNSVQSPPSHAPARFFDLQSSGKLLKDLCAHK